MMESIALTESHIVEEEDYVLVSLGSLDDDDSYDHCDDDSIASTCDASTSSYSISTSENFKTSTSHLGSLAEEATDVSVVSTEDSEDKSSERGTITLMIGEESVNIKDPAYEEKPPKQTCEENCEKDKKDLNESKEEDASKIKKKKLIEKKEESQKPKVGGSRLSNKKRRKKMKLMKKAEAARKAQELLAEMKKNPPPPIKSDPVSSHQESKVRTKSKKKGPRSNIAVSCATESIAQYRDEHNLKALPAQNYMSLL